MVEEMSKEQEDAFYKSIMEGVGSPVPEEKHNIHKFLHDVSESNDTTKTGYLTAEELGTTPYSERTYKKLQLVCGDLCNDDIWESYFAKKAEILTSTSLSRDAKLITLGVLQKREIADVTKPKTAENKGWFKKKESNTPNE